MNRRITVFLLLIFFLSTAVFSQTFVRKVERDEEAWRYLVKARVCMENTDYSGAIENAELAKASVKQNADWELFTLQNTQKKSKVRKAGDKLEDVLKVMKELQLDDAVSIINDRIEEYGMDYFDGKFSELLNKEEYFSHCPEADYIISKVYQLEGEYALALNYMNLSYDYCDNLVIPAQKYEILYALAALAEDLEDEDAYEKYLLSVLKDNQFYTDTVLMKALTDFPKKDNASDVEQFFMLYRCDSYDSIKALSLLSEFYTRKGELSKALSCATLGSITIVTKIEAALSERIIDYKYTTFADLLIKSGRYSDIVEWGSNNKIWELLYEFGDVCSADGNLSFATEMFKILAGCLGDDYWKKRSAARIKF